MAAGAVQTIEAVEIVSTGLNRWWRVCGGLMMNVALGTLYAWSVFVAPLEKEFGWKRADKDEDGYISVIGRADDLLNVAGHRIGTAEVESALVSHPAVAEAAAIGIPDALKGEAIVAFVQLRAGHLASDSLTVSLIEHVRRELGPIATPSAIKFVAALPKTRSGKIMRRLLKAQETGAEIGDLSTLEQ